jgi:type IV secretion system protein VirB6
MDVQIAQTLFQAIDDALKSTLATGTAKVMFGVGAVFGTFWLIHLTLKSIHWLFQGLDVAFQDLLLSIGKASFIMFFAFNVGWYINTVVPLVNGFPNWVTQMLSTTDNPQQNMVDTLIGQFIESLTLLVDRMEFSIWDDFNKMALGIAVFILFLIGGIPFMLVCVGTMITLKVATIVILAVGPLFLAFGLFEQTRQWFWGWVSVLGGFMLTQILFGVVITLEINFINTFIVTDGKIETTWLDAISILIYFGAFTFLAVELPNYAASIMGGAPSQTTGVGGIMGKTLGASAAKRMSKALGSRLLRRVGRNRIS